MNKKDIIPKYFPVQPMQRDEKEDTKMLCLLILFLAMDDEAREAFLKEADQSCFNAPTET